MSTLAEQLTPDTNPSSGGRMVAVDGRTLPLQGACLTADARAGVVRVTLEQHFLNPFNEPLEVTYLMPLPADGAVSGFAFRIGERRVVGEVDTKRKAKERFEEAILDGRTAALLDQERSSLFTQRVGNIPARTEVVSELTIDQRLAFLPDGHWEWRFPTVASPRYLGAGGRVADAARVTIDVADAALPVRLSLRLSIRDQVSARPESPSHRLHTEAGVQRLDVQLADDDGAALDRDVVVRWKSASLQPGVELDTCRLVDGTPANAAHGLLTLVPPLAEARHAAMPRDLVILLDTSGSMSGEPLDQARRVASALVDSLTDDDFVELIEFSNSPRRWKSRPTKGTASNRKDAQAWLSKLRASGGTEMKAGILEALQPLRRDAQRQVVLMTDGQVGFEDEVVHAIYQRLPAGSRVHTVGIGSGVNRSLTMPAARAGRGVEQIIGLGEDAERAAQAILARTVAPLVTQLELSGSALQSTASRFVNDLYARAPSLIPVQLHPGGGELVVRGLTAGGEYRHALTVQPIERGEGSRAVACLFARELVEDLELQKIATGAEGLDARITQVGLDFQISTRLTSWVAVSEEATVDPRAARRKVTMPQQLPYGVSAEGLGLRASAPVGAAMPTPAGSPHSAGKTRGGTQLKLERLRSEPVDQLADLEAAAPAADEGFAEAFDGEHETTGSFAAPAAKAKGRTRDEPPLPPARRVSPAAPTPAPAQNQGARPMTSGPQKSVAPQPTGAKVALPAREFKARLVLLKDGRLAIEFTVVGGELPWAPTNAQVLTRAGALVSGTIDGTRTTAPGLTAEGLTLTLVLEVPSHLTEVVTVSVDTVGQVVLLQVQ